MEVSDLLQSEKRSQEWKRVSLIVLSAPIFAETFGIFRPSTFLQIHRVCIGENEGCHRACTPTVKLSMKHPTATGTAETACIKYRRSRSSLTADLSINQKKKRY